MRKTYGISGTPWHVERVHNNDPEDSRRHRSKCSYYVKDAKTCAKLYGLCVGASHCKYYREKDASTITPEITKSNGPHTLQKPTSASKQPLPERKTIDPHSITPGTIITVQRKRYLVTSVTSTPNLTYQYTCRRVEEKRANMLIPSTYYLYGKMYLCNEEPCKFQLSQIETVSNIPEKALNQLKQRHIIHTPKHSNNNNGR